MTIINGNNEVHYMHGIDKGKPFFSTNLEIVLLKLKKSINV